MASSIKTETETVVKKILPYLNRRGYDTVADLDFETAVKTTERFSNGYVDILVTCGKAKPQFVIEAKRSEVAPLLCTALRGRVTGWVGEAMPQPEVAAA